MLEFGPSGDSSKAADTTHTLVLLIIRGVSGGK